MSSYSTYSSGSYSSRYRSYTGSLYSSRLNSHSDYFTNRYRLRSRPQWGNNQWRPRCDGEVDREETSRLDSQIGDTARLFRVTDVDFELDNNRESHHTAEYETSDVVIRRGQEFSVGVIVSGDFTKGDDVIRLQLSTGPDPKLTKGTMFNIGMGTKCDVTNASAMIADVTKAGGKSTIRIRATLPCDAPIGKYSLKVIMRHKEDDGKDDKYVKYSHDQPIYVLFNVWCQEDAVYLDSEEKRHEYVMMETGRIWAGSPDNSLPWNFGQFEKEVFESAMYILEQCDIQPEARGNPVQVARAISAMVNSNDDNGVLVGNWSGNYSDGTSPTVWIGSVKILSQYLKYCRSVSYGQCWVFSGVTTSVCRALGMPARSVTNFQSAHDTDCSLTIDKFYERDLLDPTTLNPVQIGRNDSVWNFHVWNECWFRRPDLPEGYDGWQAIDATPQESSGSKMRCGPCPVAAIKKGDLYLPHDTSFVFTEVHGHRINWLRQSDGSVVILNKSTRPIGLTVSTKAVGSSQREDITDQYKYPTGTAEEERTLKQAIRYSTKSAKLKEKFHSADDDVNMRTDGYPQSTGDVEFVFTATNTSASARTVTIKFQTVATYYTGVVGDNVGDPVKVVLELEPKTEKEHTWVTKATSWLNAVDEDATLGLYTTATVQQTGQIFTDLDTFTISKPAVDIQVPKTLVKVGQQIDVTLAFVNPLAVTLTNGSFTIESSGLLKHERIFLRTNIQPGQEVKEVIKVTPRVAGSREIVASFHSRQLVNISGCASVQVQKA